MDDLFLFLKNCNQCRDLCMIMSMNEKVNESKHNFKSDHKMLDYFSAGIVQFSKYKRLQMDLHTISTTGSTINCNIVRLYGFVHDSMNYFLNTRGEKKP